MIPPGSVVAGYRIERVLGTGGMGIVYAAADPNLPRLDALKVLSAHLGTDPDFRARFLREAEVAAGLDHPNIVSIYNRGETPQGQLWIAMQLVEGTDAEEALRAGTMSAHRAVHIIAEIAQGLDYAHGRGVIHRDVKPANFLLSGNVGPEERVLLADFGIARARDDAAMTAAGSVVATAAFAAPEVVSGGAAEARSDLYALGASLYRLLTGQNPFPGETMSAQMMAHLRQPPPRITAVAPWLPPAFDSVIATAMAKDPAARYQSGQALAVAAQAALRMLNRPVDPAAATHLAPVLAPQTSGTPAGPPGQAWPAPGQPPRGYPAQRGPVRRTRTALIVGATVLVLVAGATTAVVLTRSHNASDASATSATSTTAGSPAATALPAPAPAPAPTTTPPPAPVDDADLPGLLLPADQVTHILGVDLAAKPPVSGIANDSAIVTPTQCISALMPVQRLALDDTGFRAGYVQQFLPDQPGGPSAAQAVVTFPSPEMAAAFVSREEQLWQPCANTTLTVRGGPTERVYQLAAPVKIDGMLSVVATRDQPPIQCEHALTSRGNVVVDVTACLVPTVAGQATTIARAVADRIK
ncbi:hypothetical protein B1R94_27630 [Mycolicibacterium litorale]|nr:hypothetical protein B1R94_27630 [Mycolicibacterium litorale]